MPSPVRIPEDVESAEQKLAGGIAGADLRAAGGLSEAKTALAKTEEQLRRAQRVGSYTRPGYSLHELELAQREDEQLIVSVCMRMKQRDEARRKLRARELEMGEAKRLAEQTGAVRSPAAVVAPQLAAADERRCESSGADIGRSMPRGPLALAAAAQKQGDRTGAWSFFPSAMALLLGLVTAAAGPEGQHQAEVEQEKVTGGGGRRPGHAWMPEQGGWVNTSYRDAIASALRMVEAEVTDRCYRQIRGIKAHNPVGGEPGGDGQPGGALQGDTKPLDGRYGWRQTGPLPRADLNGGGGDKGRYTGPVGAISAARAEIGRLQRELAEARQHISRIEHQDGVLLAAERERREQLEAQLNQASGESSLSLVSVSLVAARLLVCSAHLFSSTPQN